MAIESQELRRILGHFATGVTVITTKDDGGSPFGLTANAFTRTGYTFSGWNTLANGTGTAYADQASYPFTASVTLYAQWKSANADLSGLTISSGTL